MDYAFLRAHDAVRESTPLIQCLTNKVVSNVTANALLAIGASPAMVDTPEESCEFAQVASGVLINCGTPSSEQYGGMREAIAGARSAQTPWVLDPVGAGGLSQRTEFMREVLPLGPAQFVATHQKSSPSQVPGRAAEASNLPMVWKPPWTRQ